LNVTLAQNQMTHLVDGDREKEKEGNR